jgi:hypothetical protein
MIHNQSLFLKIASFCISVIKKLEPLSFRDQLGLKKKNCMKMQLNGAQFDYRNQVILILGIERKQLLNICLCDFLLVNCFILNIWFLLTALFGLILDKHEGMEDS